VEIQIWHPGLIDTDIIDRQICAKLAAKNWEKFEFHQDTWNRYLTLGFVSAYIPWYAISYLDLQQPYNSLQTDLVVLSTSTLSNICRREYALTIDAIKKWTPSPNEVS
jgi:antitoxin component HigA of HigAB toxin-antitoxin module